MNKDINEVLLECFQSACEAFIEDDLEECEYEFYENIIRNSLTYLKNKRKREKREEKYLND